MKESFLKVLIALTMFVTTGCGQSQVFAAESLSADLSADLAPQIEEKVDEAFSYMSWEVTYSNGNKLLGKDYISHNSDTLISIDEEKLAQDVKAATASYNTAEDIPFETTEGNTITLSGDLYGPKVDVNAEFEDILNMFHYKESQDNREPIYAKKTNGVGKDYIEVSLSNQMVYVYRDGGMAGKSSCVTGTAGTSLATPPGCYCITERVDGKYLRGPGYVTWVNKWMRLTGSGIGLHDAVWRGSFGGDIYTYDGSHGCINLPLGFASWLYDNTFVGMPVIIY